MEYIIVVFRSRASVVAFSEFLTTRNIKNQIINTPKEAGIGCGLCVKININTFQYVKRYINGVWLNNFVGFYLVKNLANKRIVKSI